MPGKVETTDASDLQILYTTLPEVSIAQSIAKKLVSEGLCACSNIIPGMLSCYRWQGELCEEQECILLLKTTAAAMPQLLQALAEEHPYDLPCMFTLSSETASLPYLNWIHEQQT